MSKPTTEMGATPLYDEHMNLDVDHRGHQLRKGSGFIQVTPKGSEATLWKLHLSVDPGQELGDLKRSWDVFNKVVDSDPAFSSAFKVSKPETAMRMSNPASLQAGKQITYYIPDTMNPATLERFVGTVESEFKAAGIKPGPQVKYDRAVPGSSGYSSYRSDVAAPRYMEAIGKTEKYAGSADLQALQGAMEDGDPALKHLKADQLYNLSDKPDPFHQIKLSPTPLSVRKAGVDAAETVAEKKSGGMLSRVLHAAKSLAKRIPGIGAAVIGGVALYEMSDRAEAAPVKPALTSGAVQATPAETSPTRKFNSQAQTVSDEVTPARPALRPERKIDLGHH